MIAQPAPVQVHETDLLIVGGGTAGCLAAVEAREKNPDLRVLIMDKAHIDRSGCLATGMNAINAYLNPGETPDSFTKFVRFDNIGLVREDLVRSMAELFEYAVKKVEGWGLPVQKREDGEYLPRGRWNIQINGESIKPIIARAAMRAGAKTLNWVAATNYLRHGDRVVGAMGFNVRDGGFHVVKAKSTLVATGGAAGLYRPHNVDDAQHKTWYSPFNTGAGYAMGIRAGAEMTSFEMRYIALRTKDVIAPTGTIALGANAAQVNGRGERFMETRWESWGGDRAPTPIRSFAPIMEIKEGRGPVYLDTTHLDVAGVRKLKERFLDMYPDQVLYWVANGIDPSKTPVEVQTTEPYVVGGHCQAGYWIDVQRRTTLPGLYAAGDVAGGAPYKFISGCWAEGVIAARDVAAHVDEIPAPEVDDAQVQAEQDRIYRPIQSRRNGQGVGTREMEARLQKILEQYAGGPTVFYEMNEERLAVAEEEVDRLVDETPFLTAESYHDLMHAHSVIDRIDVARVLVRHLRYRKETRWPSYQTRLDYPERDDDRWLLFVNSRQDPATGAIEMLERPYTQLIEGNRYAPNG